MTESSDWGFTTGMDAAPWLMDVIEQLVMDPDPSGGFSPESLQVVQMLVAQGSAEYSLGLVLYAAGQFAINLRLQLNHPDAGDVDADEQIRRAFKSTRSVFRGDGPTDPTTPSDQLP